MSIDVANSVVVLKRVRHQAHAENIRITQHAQQETGGDGTIHKVYHRAKPECNARQVLAEW